MKYSKEHREKALDKVFSGMREGKSVRAILREDKTLPANKTLLEWIDNNEDYSKQYARAIDDRAELIFEEILTIADESDGDVMIDSEGKERINNEFVQRSRIRIDARKWMLGKMKPKKYGDRITNELVGDDKNPISIVTEFKIPKNDR